MSSLIKQKNSLDKQQRIERVVKRSDFIRASKTKPIISRGIILQIFKRGNEGNPRYGITVTKKIGNAIIRNRIKRRSRHAIKQLLPKYGKSGYDYILIATNEIHNLTWKDILEEIVNALEGISE